VTVPTNDARIRFTAMVQLADKDIDLLAACLLLAKEDHPALSVAHWVHAVDAIAARLRGRITPGGGSHNAVYAINRILFDELGFRGDSEHYDDPDNCMMHLVLQRRVGIPITLSILYMEVARRLSLRVRGVGFPGHFLVRCQDVFGTVFLDPFHEGKLLLRSDLEELLRRLQGPSAQLLPAHIAPVGNKAILTRVLHNLKGMYYHRGDFQRTLAAVERIVLLNPHLPDELRDRGLLYSLTGRREAAIADLRDYLDRWPDAPDAARIREHLSELQAQGRA
jgi:regulator of sirC expression with transglutaminase-like and TPR domain